MSRRFTILQAIHEALDQKLADDRRVMLTGEDIGVNGGVFRATEGLFDKYGKERVVDTPLAEAGIIGSAIGLALNGFIPVVEIQFWPSFIPASSRLITHAARMRYRTRGQYNVPLVIRTPYGAGIRGRSFIRRAWKHSSSIRPASRWSCRAILMMPKACSLAPSKIPIRLFFWNRPGSIAPSRRKCRRRCTAFR